jgi:Protein of unknown function (DUF2950)
MMVRDSIVGGHGRMSPLVLALVLAGVPDGAAAQQPKTYGDPQQAATELVAIAKNRDVQKLRVVFGAEFERLLSDDTVQQRSEFDSFAERAAEYSEAVSVDADSYELIFGKERWPFPIPLKRAGRGWQFDTEGGVEEMLARRIGRNELHTVGVCDALAAAQWDYFLDGDWDSDQVHEFAQQFFSTAGAKDGLYWRTGDLEPPSPIGSLVALATGEGYQAPTGVPDEPAPYHGYRFRMLTRQGPSAPGGAHDYVVNGNMISGFAVVAYPAEYGVSGIMTFLVNQQGRVYEKDLGENSEQIATALTVYDPDKTWKPVSRLR